MNLENLPSNSDVDFWKGAEMEVSKGTGKKCEHKFVHKTAQEVECVECGIGFYLNPESYIEDGKLFVNGKLVVW